MISKAPVLWRCSDEDRTHISDKCYAEYQSGRSETDRERETETETERAFGWKGKASVGRLQVSGDCNSRMGAGSP